MRIILAIILALITAPAYAATWYVSSGADLGACTEVDKCSFHVARSTASAGDTIIFSGGTYTDGHGSGFPWTVTKQLTLQAAEGETVWVDGEFLEPGGYETAPVTMTDEQFTAVRYTGLIEVDADNVVIDGINVKKSLGRGIDLEEATGATIKNLTVQYCMHVGIETGPRNGTSTNNTIDSVTVEYCNYAKTSGVYDKWNNISAGVHDKGQGNTIKNSVIRYNHCAGIEGFMADGTTIENNEVYGNGWTQIHQAKDNNIIIKNNMIYGCQKAAGSTAEYGNITGDDLDGYGAGIWLSVEVWDNESAWNTGHRVYDNLIADASPGIYFGVQGTSAKPYWQQQTISDCQIYNNTVILLSGRGVYDFKNAVRIKDYSHIGANVVFKNNLFVQDNGTIAYADSYTSGITFDYNQWSLEPATVFKGGNDPTYAGAMAHTTYFSKTSGWDTITAASLATSDFMLSDLATHAIDDGVNDTNFQALRNSYNGAAPDNGGLEYDDEPAPTTPATIIYTLDSDGSDSGTDSKDLSATGTPDHAGATNGILVDAGTDGIYSGALGSEWNVNELSGIARIYPTTIASGETKPIMGRYDKDGGENWALVLKYNTSVPSVRLGYSDGDTDERVDHATTPTVDTEYYIGFSVDGVNKLVSIYLYDTNGGPVGSDIVDQAVLSARTWNNSETNFIIGAWLDGGSRSATYVPNMEIRHVEVYPVVLPKATITARVVELSGGGSPASPKISENYWCSSDGTALSADQSITMPGQKAYHCFVGSEEIFSDDGLGTFISQVTASATNSKTLSYESGYGTTKVILSYSAAALDRFGALQLANTDPISEGTTDVVDSEGNAFDLDGDAGLDNALTYKPVFSVETKPPVGSTSSAGEIQQTSSGQPMEQ